MKPQLSEIIHSVASLSVNWLKLKKNELTILNQTNQGHAFDASYLTELFNIAARYQGFTSAGCMR